MANGVIAFAANCDQLSNIEGPVAIMVHKHVSFNVEARHYPIVGECILEAIKIVLGDAATKEIMDAWTEGYQFLADLLIDLEKKKSTEYAEKEGIAK